MESHQQAFWLGLVYELVYVKYSIRWLHTRVQWLKKHRFHSQQIALSIYLQTIWKTENSTGLFSEVCQTYVQCAPMGSGGLKQPGTRLWIAKYALYENQGFKRDLCELWISQKVVKLIGISNRRSFGNS